VKTDSTVVWKRVMIGLGCDEINEAICYNFFKLLLLKLVN
jgi:hypothetical protein